MKYVIIGGVAGGATAVARIRRADESAQIVLIEKGKYISYANCGLPYYIGGVIPERERLFVQTPASFGKRFNIDVRMENEVVGMNPEMKTVSVRRPDGSLYTESYDKLLLSPGASAVIPPLPGIDSEGIFTLRNVPDTDRIKAYLTSHPVRHALIVGGGFIGLEMAENLAHTGAAVSVVEMGNQVMAPVDYSIASHVHQHLLQKGVHLYLEQSVERFERHGELVKVFLSSGLILEADLVLLSIGVRPETKLAREAGLKIGETGGIWVSEYLQTSAADVYAVGDAVEFPHPLTGKPWLNYLANPANRQGRIVADNLVFGNKTVYEGAIGTAIAKVFDLTVASTGLPAKRLKQMGITYLSSTTHSASHAGYYPGAMPLTLKLTFHPDNGKLYGAQCVGYAGVDKRIDQISLVIKNGGTVADLIRLEQAYAPPFSSAKDPVAIAGYVAGNILSGGMPVALWHEVPAALAGGALLLDVRTREEFALGAIPGAVNIPLDELRERLGEIPADRAVLVYCAVGLRGYLGLKILSGHGFKNVKNLSGGYKTYSTAMAPLVNGERGDNGGKQGVGGVQNRFGGEVAGEEDGIPEHPVGGVHAGKTIRVDACGLQCPGPILKVKQAMDGLAPGDRVEITATDAGFARDAGAWCNTTGNALVASRQEKGRYTVVLEKGEGKACSVVTSCQGKGKTLIMFSDDLDKALATFVLANGAAATGEKVTIFFTFWGLNVIKKTAKPAVKKDLFGRMFSWMLPSDSSELSLSKMSMLGMGDWMMRYIMQRKGIDSLESLRSQALESGVEFIACQMSMDVMGVAKEELLDEVTIGGVATYMERAEAANVNLFI